MKFFTQDNKKGVRFDDRSLLADLKNIDEEAASQYLEHAVVQRRSAVRLICLPDKCPPADDGAGSGSATS